MGMGERVLNEIKSSIICVSSLIDAWVQWANWTQYLKGGLESRQKLGKNGFTKNLKGVWNGSGEGKKSERMI